MRPVQARKRRRSVAVAPISLSALTGYSERVPYILRRELFVGKPIVKKEADQSSWQGPKGGKNRPEKCGKV